MKKALSLILVLILTFSSFPLSVFADETQSLLSDGEFSTELAKLLSEDSGEYFDVLTLDVENNTIEKDGEEKDLSEYGVDYSSLSSAKPVVPAVAVLDTIGKDAEYNSDTAELEVDGKSVSLVDGRADEDDIISENNGFVTVEGENNTTTEIPSAYLTEETAEDMFALDMRLDNGKIRITSPYQTMRLIVQTKSGVLKNSYNAKKVLSRKDGYTVLQYDTELKTKNAYEKLKKAQNVKYVNTDSVKSVQSLVSDREGAKRIQSDRYIEYLKENSKTTPVTVAVLDTGADVNHELLKNRLVTGYNIFTKNSNVSDGHSHGTHCAGIIADNTPDNVKIMPVKVLRDDGYGTDSGIGQGIDWAVAHGAKIISMSLGGQTQNPRTDEIGKAVLRAYNKGVLVVCAAGNSTDDTKNYSPAGVKECITVASCPADEYRISAFSNFGNEIDVAAPGENILSSVPGNKYKSMSGTSMACPYAAASAALVYINNPSLTPSQIESELKNNITTDMLIKGWDKYSGNGYINFGKILGDNVLPKNCNASPSSIELSAFSKASGYLFTASISGDYTRDVLTDASYTVKSEDESIAILDGRHIVPKGEGETTITVTTSNGLKSESKVKCVKKEVWIDYAASSYAGGNGTKSSPYLISTPEQLAKLSLDTRNGVPTVGKYYKLTKDIDLAGKDFHTIVYTFDSVDLLGNPTSAQGAFEGNFDGNNHKIKNMTVFADEIKRAWFDTSPYNERWYSYNYGLFSSLYNVEIKNLGIENAYVSAADTGILFANDFGDYDYPTKIENVYTSGFSAGYGMFYGIWNSGVYIKNCYSSATTLMGGFASMIYSANNYYGSTISNCFFCGEILTTDDNSPKSGFITYIDSNIEDFRASKVFNCFSSAVPNSSIGFAYSNNFGTLKGCYYSNKNKYGIKTQSSDKYGRSYAKDDSFFKNKSTYLSTTNWDNANKWDFTNIWDINPNINNGYPYLKNNKPENSETLYTNTWLDYAANSFAGGDGTKNKPYKITTAEELARIAKYYRYGGAKEKYFSVENDIDLSSHEWYSIGAGRFNNSHNGDRYPKRIFRGHIEGNGHTISGMTVSDGGDYTGFISILDNGSVNNLNFTAAKVKGDSNCAVICGLLRINSTVSNCNVIGEVTGSESAYGGICGTVMGTSKIVLCTSNASVSGDKSSGIAGANDGGIIERCSYNSNGSTKYAFTYSNRGEIKNCVTDKSSSYAFKNNNGLLNHCVTSDKSYVYRLASGGTVNSYSTVSQSNFATYDFENVWEIKSGKMKLKDAKYTETDARPDTKWSEHCATSFAGGNGKRTNPFLVSTPEQFAFMVKYISANFMYKYAYKLTKDIDMSAHLYDFSSLNQLFVAYGYIDGDCHTVKNIYFEDYGIGLFPYTIGGEVRNLYVENVYGNTCAVIAKQLADTGLISDCHIINGRCKAVTEEDNQLHLTDVGGIVAYSSGTVERCSFSGEIEGYTNVAGIAGYNSGTVQNCYTNGKITGHNGVGCISGNSSFGEVINCYSLMEVNQRDDLTYTPNKNCYNAFKYASTEFYTYTTEQLKDKQTYKDWDFNEIWDINSEVNEGYPTLKPQPYRSITYVLNGGTLTGNKPSRYRTGTVLSLPGVSRNGYRFDGWYSDKEYKNKAGLEIGAADLGDVTLYAKLTPVYYIKYYANGASGKMTTQLVEGNKSTALSNNLFKKTGYVFCGWSKTAGGSVVYSNQAKVTNAVSLGTTLNLYAKWKPITYKVKYYSGIYGKKKTYTQTGFVYNQKKALRKNTYKYDNFYVFGGWCVNGASSPTLENGEKVKNLTTKNGATVKLEAYWVPASTYKIKYNLGGGKLPKKAKKKIKAGTGYTLPKPTKKGYKFVGWYSDKKYKKKITRIKPWIEKTPKVYAKWKKK